jgi:hypothetical protein
MIVDSSFEYYITHISIFVLHFYAPACSTYTTIFACRAFLRYNKHAEMLTLTVLQRYLLAETVFYLFFLWYRMHLQQKAIHPPLKTPAERRRLFDDVKREIHNGETYLAGWFHGAKIEDIGRKQVTEFLDWVFFDSRAAESDEDELEHYVQEMEKLVGRRLGKGSPNVKALRLTLDPIAMECRSLLWYFVSLSYVLAYLAEVVKANREIADDDS